MRTLRASFDVTMRCVPVLCTLFFVACGGAPPASETTPVASTASGPTVYVVQASPAPVATQPVRPVYRTDDDRLVEAMTRATPGPRRVLETVRTMLSEGVTVRGSCWDWVHAVFTRSRGDTLRVFGGRRTGPFADTALISPGDWVYLNHVDGSGTHSAIFVEWADEPARVALMVSYAGRGSDTPGRFGQYDLSQVYRVMRLSDSDVTPPPPRRLHRHHSQ